MRKFLYVLPMLLATPASATDLKIACPSACTVTLPAATWDAIGGALNDSIKVRQDLFSEMSRQLREQMPKADPAPPEPAPAAPPAP